MLTYEMTRSLAAAASLINTTEMVKSGQRCPDELETVESLEVFLSTLPQELQWPTKVVNSKQLHEVKKVRDKLRPLWENSPISSLPEIEVINTLTDGVTTRLISSEDPSEWAYRYYPLPVSPGIADTMKASIGSALSEMVVLDETARLRICAGEGCEATIVDMTRNRSKLFCDFGNCANRAHVRAYRARKASEQASGFPEGDCGSHQGIAEPTAPRLKKPSAAEKAASLKHPRSTSETAAKGFRDQMRQELFLKRQQSNDKHYE